MEACVKVTHLDSTLSIDNMSTSEVWLSDKTLGNLLVHVPAYDVPVQSVSDRILSCGCSLHVAHLLAIGRTNSIFFAKRARATASWQWSSGKGWMAA